MALLNAKKRIWTNLQKSKSFTWLTLTYIVYSYFVSDFMWCIFDDILYNGLIQFNIIQKTKKGLFWSPLESEWTLTLRLILGECTVMRSSESPGARSEFIWLKTEEETGRSCCCCSAVAAAAAAAQGQTLCSCSLFVIFGSSCSSSLKKLSACPPLSSEGTRQQRNNGCHQGSGAVV